MAWAATPFTSTCSAWAKSKKDQPICKNSVVVVTEAGRIALSFRS